MRLQGLWDYESLENIGHKVYRGPKSMGLVRSKGL
jgi:hypothetical protein